MVKRAVVAIGVAAAACMFGAPAASAASPDRQGDRTAVVAIDVSAQTRRAERPRIPVYPLPGPLRRECVAVFQERWIPQWGGWVLYPGQRCWWTRARA